MDNIPTISTQKVADRYETLGNRLNELFVKLYEEHCKMLEANTLYRKCHFGDLILSLAAIAVSLYFLVFNDNMKYYYMSAHGAEDSLFKGILVMIIFMNAVSIVRYIYSKKLDATGRRINSCKRTAEKRMETMKNNDFYGQVSRAAESGDSKFSADQKNDLGDKICALRDKMHKANKSAGAVGRIISPLLAAVYFLFGFVLVIMNRDEIPHGSYMTWMMIFGVYTYFAIDVVMCLIGGHLGKFMRGFGVVLAAVTCGFELWAFSEASLDNNAFDIGIPVLGSITELQLVVILQFLSMLIGVLKADYLGMKTKWNKGFELVMSYGEPKSKTCGSVMRRGAFSGLIAVVSWYSGNSLMDGNMIQMITFPLLFWLSMPLMKPFGSTIYAFFGRAKSISITLYSLAMFVLFHVSKQGNFDIKQLTYLGICAAVYFIIGGIVKHLNDNTMTFDFMHRLT